MVLMVLTAPAETPQQIKADPGTNNPPPTGAILDLNGQPIPTSYQLYQVSFQATVANTAITFAFRNDPAWIYFSNASVTDVTTESANLLLDGDFSMGPTDSNTPVDWTYVNDYGAYAGGIVNSDCGYVSGGNCWYDGAVQAYDAISQTISTNPGDTYQISFYMFATGGSTFSQLSTNGDTTDIGGNGIDLLVYAGSGVPPPPTQEVLTLTEMGTGVGYVTDNSGQINCSDSNGSVTATPSCSGSYTSGTSVTLNAYPSSTAPNNGGGNVGTTFGGWGPASGPCASVGTSTTCTFMITSSQTVTANFVPPQNPQPLSNQYCSTGSSNTASATYCPNGVFSGGVCQDPNGVVFTAEIPVVNLPPGECFSLQVIATEVTGTGVCPATQAGFYGQGFGVPGGNTTDFDCRFVSYYNYGTTDAAGDVQTPLCYPYSNGNCVYYNLQLYDTESGMPVGPAPASETPAGVIWQINIDPSNAPLPPVDQFTPPPGYGTVPRMLDNPDEYNANNPGLPYGTSYQSDALTGCNDAMLMGSGGSFYPYSGTAFVNSSGKNIYCQFNNDISLFFTGKVGGDPPIAGGKSPTTNDVVLAFLPTSNTGNGTPTATPPAPVAPAISLSCQTATGCALSGSTITFTEGTAGTAAVTETDSPYPSPALVGWSATTGTAVSGVTAAEVGNTVTLTASGDFGSQFASPNVVIVSNCATTGYNGTFTITGGGSGQTTLTYQDNSAGLTAETDVACSVQAATPPVLPAGLTFTPNTGVLSGTPADGTIGNYPINFTASNGVSPAATLSYTLTVSPAALTITASSPSMTYGEAAPAVGFTVGTLVNGDSSSVLGTIVCTTTATSMSAVGSSPTTSCSGAMDTTYMINYVGGTVTVNPAPVIVTASSPSMTYGEAVPTITPIYTYPAGTLNSHVPMTAPTCTTAATSMSTVGSSPATSCLGAGDPDYTFTYMAGSVTVKTAAVVVTASSGTMTQGGTPPTITPSYGYPVGTLSSHAPATPPTCSTTATSSSPAGSTYPSTCVGAADPDYTFTYVPGSVTVSTLEISPQNPFGTVYLNGFGIEFITLTNKGTTGFKISSLSITGPGNALADYGTANLTLCPPMIERLPATLPAGKSCTIGVDIHPIVDIFSPTASTATLTIADAAPGNPHQVPLTALVIDPQVSLAPTSLSFGNQKTGTTSAAQKVTLTNSGLTSLQLTGLSISPNFAFANGTTCKSNSMLSPGGTCLMYVTFTPTTKGRRYSGGVSITDLTLSGGQFIPLSGTGD